jgi:hypothetical protein
METIGKGWNFFQKSTKKKRFSAFEGWRGAPRLGTICCTAFRKPLGGTLQSFFKTVTTVSDRVKAGAFAETLFWGV